MDKYIRKIVVIICILLIVVLSMTAKIYSADLPINWTEDEVNFIKNNPTIKIGVDPEFVPFEFIDTDGKYKGIAADYISLINERTGLKFEVIEGLTWHEAYNKALQGDIHVLPAISKTEEREKHFLFSKPYYQFKRVIVTRNDDSSISGIDDLYGQTVAVQRNSSHHSYLMSKPKINMSFYESAEAALTAVANYTERYFVGNLTTTNYLIRSNGLTNLKYIAFESEKQQGIHFAVNKDCPELISILNKAIDSITEEEKIIINKKWIALEPDTGTFIRIALIVGSFGMVIMSVSFYWIVRLRAEVKKRKLIQLDLEKAKKEADEANEFKSNFMARMSHEIRTPLNAITGMIYLLKQTETSITQKKYIDIISQASSNMLGIINDLLDFSKIEAGKVELEITSFSMDQVINEVVNIMYYKIEEQKIKFKLIKDPLVPSWFFGDPKRIEQILLNVLNNAVKFTDSGEVSLEITLLSKESEKHNLLFCVKDTGIGMNKDQLEKLFMPFTQGDVSINRRFGGSGLGLSIVKNLLDMMEGKIEVMSTPGVGSTFNILLSLIIDKEKENVERTLSATVTAKLIDEVTITQSNKDSCLGNITNHAFVMVVEDNSTNQLIATTLLKQMGIESILAHNGKLAIELFNKHKNHISLILMDLNMPHMNGYGAAKEIRKISNSVPIVAMTADSIFNVREKCEQCGINYYISKPYDPEFFIRTIKDIIINNDNKSEDSKILNQPLGLKNIGGDLVFYKTVLKEYFNENQNTLNKLEQAVSEKRYADAAQIVHKIKSSSSTIGAKGLYELSVKLQKALEVEKEEEIKMLQMEFSIFLSKLLEKIAALID